LLAFFTVVPLKTLELDFRCAWALPYVAAPVVGGVGALVYAATHDPLLAYLALLLATGLNHLDGLADSADALMVRDKERARAVLDDPRRGTAGVFAVAVVVALAAGASPRSPLDYLAADLYSKALTRSRCWPLKTLQAGARRPLHRGRPRQVAAGGASPRHSRRLRPRRGCRGYGGKSTLLPRPLQTSGGRQRRRLRRVVGGLQSRLPLRPGTRRPYPKLSLTGPW
jgi:hypothetical protein